MSDHRVQPVDGRRTARFDQPRPFAAEPTTHVHGALDIAAPVGTPIVAPEGGRAFAWVAIRSRDPGNPNAGIRWPEPVIVDGTSFEWANYFYDTFGGVIVLIGYSGLTHIITHSWINQLFNRGPMAEHRVRFHEPQASSWPIGMSSKPFHVRTGETIGSVGNAGFSTGPHIHWEIHPNRRWTPHKDRVDPEQWLDKEPHR